MFSINFYQLSYIFIVKKHLKKTRLTFPGDQNEHST